MRAALAATALLLAAPATAGATKWFHSPSGNLQCEVTRTYAYCQSFNLPRSATLHPDGHTKVCRGMGCLGDGPDNAFTLGYGHSTRVGPFKCTSQTNGMTCKVVSSGRGYRISRTGVTRF